MKNASSKASAGREHSAGDSAEAAALPRGAPAHSSFVHARISSLLGVVPLAWLWITHIWGASSLLSGVDAFDAKVASGLASWPHRTYLLGADLILLWLPLAYHAAVGVSRFSSSRHNVRQYATFRNWAYTAQHWTGLLLIVFLGWHLWHTWGLVHIRWGSMSAGPHPETGAMITLGGYLVEQFSQGLAVKLLYVVGAMAAAFHVAQGLWSFLVNWGLVSGGKAMQRASVACAALFAALVVWSFNVLAELIRLGQAQ